MHPLVSAIGPAPLCDLIMMGPPPETLSVAEPVLVVFARKLITLPSVLLNPASTTVMALGVPPEVPAQNTELKADVSVVTTS